MTDVLTNYPPSDAEILLGRLAEQYRDLVDRADALTQAAANVPEELDDTTTPRATDFVRQIKACAKKLEEARKAEKEPFLEQGRLVDGWFQELTSVLARSARMVEGRIEAHLRHKAELERQERARQQREAEARAKQAAEEARAREAALIQDDDLEPAIAAAEAEIQAKRDAYQAGRAAAAPPADLVRTRGDMGGVATLKREWTWEITGPVDLDALRPYLPADAVDKALRAAIRAGIREIGGTRIFQTERALVR